MTFGAHNFHCPSGRGAVISHYKLEKNHRGKPSDFSLVCREYLRICFADLNILLYCQSILSILSCNFFRSDSFTLDDVTKVDSSLPETILATEDDIEEETPVASKDKVEPVQVQISLLQCLSDIMTIT